MSEGKDEEREEGKEGAGGKEMRGERRGGREWEKG